MRAKLKQPVKSKAADFKQFFLQDFLKVKPYFWLGTEEEQKRLLDAGIALRKHIDELGVYNVVYIETSSRPIATLLNEIDNALLPAHKMVLEKAIARVNPLMNSRIDKRRLKVRKHVPFGSKKDEVINKLRDPYRIRAYNLSTPMAFSYYKYAKGKTTEEKMAQGWRPEYAIFRERGEQMFNLIFERGEKVILVDDFVETSHTMEELRDFLKKIKWVHSQIGSGWKTDAEHYERANELFEEAKKHLGEVELDNVFFASLYGHKNHPMPDWVFVGVRSYHPPKWHPSNSFVDENGESKQVYYSLESVVQRCGYPWGTPIDEVGERREYADELTSEKKLLSMGAPYSFLEMPVLQYRLSNLEIALRDAYPPRIVQFLESVNTHSKMIDGNPQMGAVDMAALVRRLKLEPGKAIEIARGHRLVKTEEDEKSFLGALEETEPPALLQRLREIGKRPEELELEIRQLVKDHAKEIQEELLG